MKTYEHLTYYVNSGCNCNESIECVRKEADRLGQIGWKLVSVFELASNLVAFFEREIPPEQDATLDMTLGLHEGQQMCPEQ